MPLQDTHHRRRLDASLPKTGPQILKSAHGPVSLLQSPNMGPGAHFCFLRPCREWCKTQCKNEGARCVKLHFCDLLLSFCKEQIPQSPCLKQHACLVDPSGVLNGFCIFNLSCFYDPENGARTDKKGSFPGTHVSKLGCLSSAQGPLRPKTGFGRRPKKSQSYPATV